MKTRKINEDAVAVQNGGCCAPSADTVEQNNSCCEQPQDGSSCCDKTESKDVNSEKTGCC